MVTGKSNLVEVMGIFRHETEWAWLVDFGLPKPVWFPKRLVEIDFGDRSKVTVTMPDWLAVEKGIENLVRE